MHLKISICTFALGAFAKPLIVGLGSSYAAGPGLQSPIGELLRQKLAAHDGRNWSFTNDAISGSLLESVTTTQAPELSGTGPRIVYIVSGGNDLNYVPCLGNPESTSCQNPISESTYKQRYSDALDAVIKYGTGDPSQVIFCLTYFGALGPGTDCPSTACPLNANEKAQDEEIYNMVVNYTVNAVADWKKTGKNYQHDVRLIPLSEDSLSHEIGSSAPWVNGAVIPEGAGGIAWHPNNAGAAAAADLLYSSFVNKS